MCSVLLGIRANSLAKGNENAASGDRAHDLGTMRPTRFQLRYRRHCCRASHQASAAAAEPRRQHLMPLPAAAHRRAFGSRLGRQVVGVSGSFSVARQDLGDEVRVCLPFLLLYLAERSLRSRCSQGNLRTGCAAAFVAGGARVADTRQSLERWFVLGCVCNLDQSLHYSLLRVLEFGIL